MEKYVILWLLSAFIVVLGVPAGDRVKTKGADASQIFLIQLKCIPDES